MEERALALAARQALLQQTAKQPVTAAVLWLTCAHLAAYNTLPSQVIHRQVALICLEPWVIHKHVAPMVVVAQARHRRPASISVGSHVMHGKDNVMHGKDAGNL